MHTRFAVLLGSTSALVLALAPASPASAADGCAPGTQCLTVAQNGTPGTGATAQCTGRFPDFVVPSTMLPANFAGPWFKLSQDYPATAPTNDAPWLTINFKNGTQGANDYLIALRDYAFDGMIAADFRPENNSVRKWYHMPLMNFGGGKREPMHGLTSERVVSSPELGLKPGQSIHNFAVGFYNAAGATAIGKVWKTANPDVSKSRFPKGSMTFKILFSDGTPGQFDNDPMAGAPTFTIMTSGGQKTVRLLQMDVAAVDSRSPTGWVFGTFAFQPTATDPVTWNRLRPVGISWGNDPGFTPADQQAGKKLKQSTISDQIPAYAAAHLGWAGRTNGPVDNPISGCLSCHGTAQFPVAADLAPFDASCNTDAQKLVWFRNFKGTKAFGAMKKSTCAPTNTPTTTSLDFSLQMQVAVQAVLQFGDKNPCVPPGPTPAAVPSAQAAPPADTQGYERVQR